MSATLKRLALGAAWVASIVVLIWLLTRLGTGSLSTPPFADSTRLRDWVDERDAVTMAFALLRLVALGLAWYLLAVTVLGLLARATRIPSLIALTDLGTIPAVRRVLGGVVGVGLTASAGALLIGPALSHSNPAPIAVHEGADRATAGAVVLERLPDGSSLVLERLPDDPGTATIKVVDASGNEQTTGLAPWTVKPGDHFWHMAEATLTDQWGRVPSDAELVPYWHAIIEANRSKLADPGNPDLILTGQVFELPPPPAAPAPPPPNG